MSVSLITERAAVLFILSPGTGEWNTADCFKTHLLLLLELMSIWQLVKLPVRIPTSWMCCVCACWDTLSGSGGGQLAVCRIRNARVNPSRDGFREHTNTQLFVCWALSRGPWSGASPELLVSDYPITGYTLTLFTHMHKTHGVLLDSRTLPATEAGKVSPAKLCVGPLPCLGRDTVVLACLQIKHSVPGPLD